MLGVNARTSAITDSTFCGALQGRGIREDCQGS